MPHALADGLMLVFQHPAKRGHKDYQSIASCLWRVVFYRRL